MHLTETTDLSPKQARELLKRYGPDWEKRKKPKITGLKAKGGRRGILTYFSHLRRHRRARISPQSTASGEGTPFAIDPFHPARWLEHVQPKLVTQFPARDELQ